MPLTGATPQNQLNALPLITAADAAAPSAYAIIGSKVTRYWNPAATGINGINFTVDPELGTASLLLSNYLDFTGMNEYVALLVCTTIAADPNVNVILRIQYRVPGGAVQPHTGTQGQTQFSNVANRTPAYSAAATWIVAYNWSNAQGGQSVTMGPDCRLWFAKDAALPQAGQLYSLHVWACQS